MLGDKELVKDLLLWCAVVVFVAIGAGLAVSAITMLTCG